MRQTFRQIIDRHRRNGTMLVLPGVHDALSARLVQQVGLESYFIGGFPVAKSRYRVPDIGLKALGDMAAAVRDIMAAAVRDIMAACHLPVFVDGDDDYGDVKNVVRTLYTYKRMGVSAILFEDQLWPKRCGHMVGKKVVPTETMEAKIRAATAERLDPETWILARTDARAVYDIDEALRRGERYLRAGADGLFIEAPRTVDELRRMAGTFEEAVRYSELPAGFGHARKRLGLEQVFKSSENVAMSGASRRFLSDRPAGESVDHRLDDLLFQPVCGLDIAQRSRSGPGQIDRGPMQPGEAP
jgi:2-methylisocitrate lyase-like PEP mutase family enzyme